MGQKIGKEEKICLGNGGIGLRYGNCLKTHSQGFSAFTGFHFIKASLPNASLFAPVSPSNSNNTDNSMIKMGSGPGSQKTLHSEALTAYTTLTFVSWLLLNSNKQPGLLESHKSGGTK